jgi:hypothetical protein
MREFFLGQNLTYMFGYIRDANLSAFGGYNLPKEDEVVLMIFD